ncbi:MAG TPA: HD domain-containing protein [Candidatus Thermoplasmatota archaeon]|nr:HD domain-containing protein [Candidatus Thermoplasmatota archaeon]
MDPGTVEFVRRALALKDTPRKGWTRAGVARPESVADHAWGVGLLAIAVADARPGLDRTRLLELALVHDLAEAVTGDLVPGDYADRAEKLARERDAMESLVEWAPLPLRRRLLDRFEEYATSASEEARLVHELDKLEMAFQADRYRSQGVRDVDAFLESAERGVASSPALRAVAERLRRG